MERDIETKGKQRSKSGTARSLDVSAIVAQSYNMKPQDLATKLELEEIKRFVKSKLKKTLSEDRSHLPDAKAIEDEKILTRAEVKTFNKSKLKHVISKETDMLPSMATLREELIPDYLPTRPELATLQKFVRSYLVHVETKEKNVLPTIEDILAEEKSTMAEVKRFDRTKLKHSVSIEKNTLPDSATLWSELYPDELPPKPELKELVKFAHTGLKHVNPNVKQLMPTLGQIEQEKVECRTEVKLFKKDSLKKVKTIEKNPLPTEADLWEEMLPDYIPPKPELTALKNFVQSSLRHVKTVEKVFKPTKTELISERGY
ncbi:hypothetical protein RF11_03890 [Thelohanellus kitauei]|uniref:Uncharacterized protein n=1 Tax=Thelohanellus kitauei TaxID=669202 RepID=A0A0C2MRX3_THEKT|nr:hypothetical protein RF11_03890 [Thelohanellus kitauei]